MEQRQEESQAGLGGWTQRLFEKALGPPRQWPEELRESNEAAASRDRERVEFKVATGRSLEYQAVPCAGTLLGLNYVPPRTPPLRQPPRQGAPQPAHSTLWVLVQPVDGLGVNTSLSAVAAGPTGFGGWHQDGFVDVSERAGLEYSLARHPVSGVSGELELVATTPRLPLLPQLTARHRVAAAQASRRLQHSTALSLPLGPALARIEVREPAPGSSLEPAEGATLKLELVPHSKRVRRLAGGAKLQTGCASAFRPGASKSSKGVDAAVHAGSSSDSDDESNTNSSSRDNSTADSQQRQRSSLPGLRLELAPATARGWEDVSSRWQQAWGGQLSSTVSYQAHQRRWNLALSQKLSNWLSAAGTLVCDAPGEMAGSAAAAAAAAEPAGEIEPAPAQEGGGRAGAALRQLSSHVRSYAAGSRLCRAGLKLHCRLRQPARQLRLESNYDAGEGGGLSHTLAYRFGRRADHRREHAWCDLELRAKPQQRQLSVNFEVFAPL